MKQFFIGMVAVVTLGSCLLPSTAMAQQPLVIKMLAEKKVAELPPGELSWRITDLHALVMFVVDATKPFSSPATLP